MKSLSATRIAAKFLEAHRKRTMGKTPRRCLWPRLSSAASQRYLGLSEENLLSEYDLARGESAAPAPQKARGANSLNA